MCGGFGHAGEAAETARALLAVVKIELCLIRLVMTSRSILTCLRRGNLVVYSVERQLSWQARPVVQQDCKHNSLDIFVVPDIHRLSVE